MPCLKVCACCVPSGSGGDEMKRKRLQLVDCCGMKCNPLPELGLSVYAVEEEHCFKSDVSDFNPRLIGCMLCSLGELECLCEIKVDSATTLLHFFSTSL